MSVLPKAIYSFNTIYVKFQTACFPFFSPAAAAAATKVASVMSDSVQPHRQQPTRLLCPWDSRNQQIHPLIHMESQGTLSSQTILKNKVEVSTL